MEFALVVIPLLILLVGMVSYGIMLAFRQNISQAAAEGARAAAVQVDPTKRTTAATTAINKALDTAGLTCAAGKLKDGATVVTGSVCTISSAPFACTTGSTDMCVKVTISYPYRARPIVPLPLLGAALPDKLSYSSTIRVS